MAKALTAQSVERLRPDPSRRLEIADALLPGLYFVVQPSGARSWAVRYRYGGKPRKLTLGTYPVLELGTARDRAREALQGVGVGRDPASEKQEAIRAAKSGVPDRDTVAAVVEAFLSRHVRPKLRASTAEHAERTLAKYIVPAWGERRIQEIARRDVIALLDDIVDSGKPIAANRVLAITRRLFNWAIDRSIVENSPCARVVRPTVEKSRDRVLTDDELRLVWKAAERRGWTSGPFVQLLILTGQRRDEVAKMARREFREGGTLWTIPAARTKNGTAQDVPLANIAREIIVRQPRISARAGTEYIFTVGGDKPICGYSSIKADIDGAVAAIALEEAAEEGREPVQVEPWRFHDLRRTAASGMARMGIALHVIEAVLNHRSGAISGVAAIYNRHSYLPEKRHALEAWASHVMGLANGPTASTVVGLHCENV